MKHFFTLVLLTVLMYPVQSQSLYWIDVDNEALRFKASFLANPEVLHDTLDARTGTRSVTYALTIQEETHPNAYYAVAVIEFPLNEIHSDSVHMVGDILDATQTSLLEDKSMELVSVQHKDQKGYPGKEYRWMLKNESGFIRHQVYLVQNRLYMLTVTTRPGENYNKEIGHFFDGFELLGVPFNAKAEAQPLAEKRFEIDFPGQVQERTQKLESAYGILYFFLKVYQPQDDDNLVYLAGYTDYPDEAVESGEFEDLEEFYQEAIKGSLTATQGTLIEQRNFRHKWRKGKEYKISLYNGRAVATYRCLLLGQTLYTYGVMTEKGNEDNKKIVKFLKSFKAIKQDK